MALVMLATTVFGASDASASIADLQLVEQAFDTLGTGGDEWSGATYNQDHDLLFVVDDEGTAYEFGFTAAGRIDRSSARTFEVNIESGDFEGVAWLSDYSYAIVSEDTGIVYQIDVSPTSSSMTWSQLFATGITSSSNSGAEGLATDGSYFYVTQESPASLTRFALDGTRLESVSLTSHLADASGVAIAADGSFLLLSDESAKAVHFDIDWPAQGKTYLTEIDLGGYGKAEGIATRENVDLFVFGERSNQTYGHWTGEIVDDVIVYQPGDVDCSGDLNINDARMLTRIAIGTAAPPPGCSGDLNGDGAVDIQDARLATLCSVGYELEVCD